MRYLAGPLLLLSGLLILAQAPVQLPAHRAGIVLVGFDGKATLAERTAILTATNGITLKTIGAGTIVLYVGPNREQPVINVLKRYAQVRYAEPDFIHHLDGGSVFPNDTFAGNQWAINTEKSSGAWSVTTGTNSVVVAVLDTGVQYSHPDLLTNIWNNPGGIGGCGAGTHGYNVLTGICDPMDDDNAYGGHGTHVAGILGAVGNNLQGVSGVNWTTSIMAVKWVDGNNTGYTSDLITAIDWVIQAKQSGINVRVVNDSATWAGTASSQALSDAIDMLGGSDILFVSASGNTAQNNDTTPRYPCDYDRPTQICAAATDSNDQLWSSANWGATTVQLGAPGVNIYSTLRQSNYGYISGGSMAAPQVSGTAALILSTGYQSVSNLRAMILNNVDHLSSMQGLVSTGGRLDVCNAVPGCNGATGIPGYQSIPVLTGIAQQGSVMGTSTGVWNGQPTSYTYQWYRCTGSAPCQPIHGATSSNYSPMSGADIGLTLASAITASNSSGSTTVFSANSPTVTSAASPFSINSNISDGSAINGNVTWQAMPSISVNFVQFWIDGVLSQTVTSSPYNYNLRLGNGQHVLGIRALSSDNRTYGFYGATITVQSPPQNTGPPVVSGTASQGQTLATSNGTWSNSPSSMTYQWLRCDTSGSNCVSISAANGATYAVQAADVGLTLRSSVTAVNAVGGNTADSAPTAVVTGSGGGTGSGITLVQSNSAHGSAVSSISAGFSGSNQAGNMIIAVVRMSTTYETVTVTDSLGNAYTDAVNQAQSSDGHQLHLFYAKNIAAGGNTVTATFNGTNNHPYLAIYEYAGLSTTNPLDQTAHAQGSSAIADSGSTSSTSTSSELVFAATGMPASYTGAVTAGSGYALLQQDTTSERAAAESALASSTGSVDGVFNLSSSTLWSAVVATFRAAGSSSPPPPPPPPPPPSGPIAFVQSNAAHGSAVGSISVGFPSANQAGDLIIAVVRMSTTYETVAVGDSAGNAYVSAASQIQTADGHQLFLFYAKNIAGSANTVTATFNGTNNHPWLAIFEYGGLSTTAPLDQVAHAQGSSASADSGATGVTAAANELVFAAGGFPASYTGAVTAGTGFTLLLQDTSSERGATESMTTSATGTFHGTFSLNPSTNWSAIIATFRQ